MDDEYYEEEAIQNSPVSHKRSLLAGALAGASSVFVSHPFDTLKVT